MSIHFRDYAKNWKTTLAGLVPILVAATQVATAVSTGVPIDYLQVISLLGIGGGLVVAKDYNVTGGTTASTPSNPTAQKPGA